MARSYIVYMYIAKVKDCLAIYYNKHENVIILIHKNKLATTQELLKFFIHCSARGTDIVCLRGVCVCVLSSHLQHHTASSLIYKL